jgi:hypothetical protein
MSQSLLYSSLAVLVFAGPQAASAQAPAFAGPVAGYIYRGDSRTIRPLQGIPGSTAVGAPLFDGIEAAAIAPGGKWAFVTKAGKRVFLRGLAGGEAVEVAVDGLMDKSDRIEWSADGSAAVLYSSAAKQLQRLRLSDSGVLVDPAEAVFLNGEISAMAVSRSGRSIALGVMGSDASGVYLWIAGGSPVRVSAALGAVAATFDATGERLYAVDMNTQRILEFESGAALAFASLQEADGTAVNPAGLAISPDGRSLILADRSTQTLRIYDRESRTLSNTIALDFTPSRLQALSDGRTFLLNGGDGKEWLMVLDAGPTPAVYFVPASSEEPL